MSDSLGDGTGHPSENQIKLYERWAQGGLALSIIGEVQGSPAYAEKPGNLVLGPNSDLEPFRALAAGGGSNGARLWLQLGHAGALSYAPTSLPKGPSALDLPGLSCGALTIEEIRAVPAEFARTAALAQQAGFGGVQIHAAHGFLLSQFLSPLFNKRDDSYGGSLDNRARLLLESIDAVRAAVGPEFPIAVKLNSSDQLKGGLSADEALQIIERLDGTSLDLIDISGGTYFPGAEAASDSAGSGPYFIEFARRARPLTRIPLMLTGGFKTRAQIEDALASGAVDVVGLARALTLEPSLPQRWQSGEAIDPSLPRFNNPPEGGVTAWYTMRLTELGSGKGAFGADDLQAALDAYEARDTARTGQWIRHFGGSNG